MKYASIQSLYKELTKNSSENAVDALWADILPLYFTVPDGYAIDPQARPRAEEDKKRADFAVRYVHNGTPRKGILIEDKRVKYESSNSKWKGAVDQLTGYMESSRVESGIEETVYGIVTIGHYSRFYEYWAGEEVLRNHSGYDGNPLHFRDDEMNIDEILCALVQATRIKDEEDAEYSVPAGDAAGIKPDPAASDPAASEYVLAAYDTAACDPEAYDPEAYDPAAYDPLHITRLLDPRYGLRWKGYVEAGHLFGPLLK